MQKLIELNDEVQINTGSIFRLFNVRRFDVMKKRADYSDIEKMKKDFYDYMLVDMGIVKQRMFSLVNITSDNNNQGSILHVFSNVKTNGHIKAKTVKNYFGESQDVFVILNN